MSNCIKNVTANITYDCNTPALRAIAGLETKAVILNRSDIDRTSLTRSGSTVTNLNLVSGATGYEITWVKQLANTNSEFSVNDGLDTFTHAFECSVFGQTAADAERIKELSVSELVMVVETKFKGVNNADSYKIFGLEQGMRMSEGKFTSLENDGGFKFKLSSVENFGESYPWLVYLETNYTTTKTKVDNLFA